jgi:hypothetical protein
MMLNIAYDVPVKLYSTMIVVSAVVLLLYDLPRLSAFFLTNRGAPPAEGSFIHARIGAIPRWTIKVLAVGSVIVSSIAAMAPITQQRETASSGFGGSWAVIAFSRLDTPADSVTDATRWRRVIFTANTAIIRFANDSLVGCGYTRAGASRLVLSCGKRGGVLHWLRDGDLLFVDGTFDGGSVRLSSRLTNTEDYPLLRSRRRFIIDR